MSKGVMKFLAVLTVVIAFTMPPALANAKGSSGRGSSVSSSSARSYSAPARSYSTTRSKPTKSKSSWFSNRDDDVECSVLKSSKHAADRIVYKRYC